MKYIELIIPAAILFSAIPAQAAAAGTVRSTDIGTVIDGAACKTYNFDDRTFVVAEDLRGYGFDVDWSESERLLAITQNPYAPRTLLSADEINISKSDIKTGEPLMQLLSSDITVTVNGSPVEAYNIDGRMVIPVRALEPYAYVEFDSEKKLVTVRGLQHYLDERYDAGNPNVTKDVKEYSQHVHNIHKNLGGGVVQDEEHDTDVTEISYTDTESGKITAYLGNPLTVFAPTGVNHFEACSDREQYSIFADDGRLLFTGDTLYRNDWGTRYILTDNRAQTLSPLASMLYGYTVLKERSHNGYWPSEEEIKAPDMRFEKFTGDGVLSENGLYFSLEDKPQLVRYNVSDVFDDIVISRDNIAYKMVQNSYDSFIGLSDNQINSMLDTPIVTDTRKADSRYILYTNGDLYAKDEKIAENIKDFIYVNQLLYVLTEDGELRSGTPEDFMQGTEQQDAFYIRSIDKGSYKDFDIIFINESNELYAYSHAGKFGSFIAGNLKKQLHGSRYILTTDNKLVHSDKNEVVAEDVKDAMYPYSAGKIYIIKTDGTLWRLNNNALERINAFE